MEVRSSRLWPSKPTRKWLRLCSMLTFLAALMVVFFWHTSLATRIVLGIAVTTLLLVTTILLWLDWNNHSGSHGPYEPPTPERSIIYKIIPPGLRNFVLGIPERWQAREFFRLNGHKLVLSTLNPSSTTMVGSTGDSSKWPWTTVPPLFSFHRYISIPVSSLSDFDYFHSIRYFFSHVCQLPLRSSRK